MEENDTAIFNHTYREQCCVRKCQGEVEEEGLPYMRHMIIHVHERHVDI